MKIRPLNDRVLVLRIDEEAKTSGGIIIPDTAKEKPQEGKVIAVDESKQDSTPVFRVKVLDTKGGLHTVIIDHQTGNVISAH